MRTQFVKRGLVALAVGAVLAGALGAPSAFAEGEVDTGQITNVEVFRVRVDSIAIELDSTVGGIIYVDGDGGSEDLGAVALSPDVAVGQDQLWEVDTSQYFAPDDTTFIVSVWTYGQDGVEVYSQSFPIPSLESGLVGLSMTVGSVVDANPADSDVPDPNATFVIHATLISPEGDRLLLNGTPDDGTDPGQPLKAGEVLDKGLIMNPGNRGYESIEFTVEAPDGYTLDTDTSTTVGAAIPFLAGTSVDAVFNFIYGDPAVPSVPDSVVIADDVASSVTGGAARQADGVDSQTIITTVNDADGQPVTGVANRLSATAPEGVTAGAFTDNGDGTYSLPVSSAVAGNYQVVVALDGESIGAPVPVNFIAAIIQEPSRSPGQEQSATGLGFLPGEQVTVTVYSDPIVLGAFTADSIGSVPVTFTENLDIGRHRVEFMGAVSGLVTVGFDVVTVNVRAGGMTAPYSSVGWALAASLLAASGFALVMARRQMARR